MIENEQQALQMIGFVSVACTLLGMVLMGLLREAKRRGKARVFLYDPDAATFKETWQKLEGNEFTIGKGDAGKRYILDGFSRLLDGRIACWIVNEKNGWCYRAPTSSEAENGDPLLQRLAVSNPQSYHLSIAKNRARDALNANSKDDKWGWVPMAVVGAIAVIGILAAAVIYIVVKIGSGAVAPTGG